MLAHEEDNSVAQDIEHLFAELYDHNSPHVIQAEACSTSAYAAHTLKRDVCASPTHTMTSQPGANFTTYNMSLVHPPRHATEHTVTPLGVRLAPLGEGSEQIRRHPEHDCLPHRASAQCGGAGDRRACNADAVMSDTAALTAPMCAINASSSIGTTIDHHDSCRIAKDNATDTTVDTAAATTASADEDAARELDTTSNFLPVMYARHVNTRGIAPPVWWGHTLSSLAPSYPLLLLFGGREERQNSSSSSHSIGVQSGTDYVINDNDSVDTHSRRSSYMNRCSHGGCGGTLMMLHTESMTWEPAYVRAGRSPAPRYDHAACVYECRWLIVGGGTSGYGDAVLYGDVHCYDVETQEWLCLWEPSATRRLDKVDYEEDDDSTARGSRDSTRAGGEDAATVHQRGRHTECSRCSSRVVGAADDVPESRLGHSMLIHEDRLYIYGGRTRNRAHPAPHRHSSIDDEGTASLATASADVYVFSLTTRGWLARIDGANNNNNNNTIVMNTGNVNSCSNSSTRRGSSLPRRAYHAACIHDGVLYIHGGVNENGVTCGDLWAITIANTDDHSSQWTHSHWYEVHIVTALPRQGHFLLGCGEALAVWGGVSASEAVSLTTALTTTKLPQSTVAPVCHSFAAVLPLMTGATFSAPHALDWMAVAVGGSAAAVTPTRYRFAAAFHDGFVYLCGGITTASIAMRSGTSISSHRASYHSHGSSAALRMIRVLATDGLTVLSPLSKSAVHARRSMMHSLCTRPIVPFDAYACATDWATAQGMQQQTPPHARAAATRVGVHRALLRQRAPKLWQQLQRCRSERVPALMTPARSMCRMTSKQDTGTGVESGDAVDALLRQTQSTSSHMRSSSSHDTGASAEVCVSDRCSSSTNRAGVIVYFTRDTSARTPGLTPLLSPAALRAVVEYLYTGDIAPVCVSWSRRSEPEDDTSTQGRTNTNRDVRQSFTSTPSPAQLEKDNNNNEDGDSTRDNDSRANGDRNTQTGCSIVTGNTAAAQHADGVARAPLWSADVCAEVHAAAVAWELPDLAALCSALSSPSHSALRAAARDGSARTLCADLLQLRRSVSSGATMTVLFVDPHTGQRGAHALHPFVLAASCAFFARLLQPLMTGERTVHRVGAVVAKLTTPAAAAWEKRYRETRNPSRAILGNPTPTTTAAAAATAGDSYCDVVLSSVLNATSRHAILVGPIPLPLPAVPALLHYLYTRQICVARELALATLLGARQLGLTELQRHCESIVARDEVNYDNCCAFYTFAHRHGAPFLGEIALITAVTGYTVVRHTPGYAEMTAQERRDVEEVVRELGSATWQPPAQTSNEMKTACESAARWHACAPR